MRKLETLDDCLFNAFANSNLFNPQDKSLMWAIIEGLNRLETMQGNWRWLKARKDHKCNRGCTIEDGDIYFRTTYASDWDANPQVCAGCMAMILYYKEVHRLPPVRYTHWDYEKEQAVKVEQESP